MSSRVAKRYARALLELAAEQGQLENWGAEVEHLARVVDSPELGPRLTSPELPANARIEAMAKLAEKLELSFPVRSFAVVLARHGRVGDIADVSRWYQALLDERLGRARAALLFAAQPADADVARLVGGLEALAGKKIIAAVKVDGSLLGGVVAELEGKTYDASLAARLAEAQRRLSI